MRHFEQRLSALERRRRARAARLALLWAIGKEPEQVALELAELSQGLAAGAMVLIMDRWPE
jgi:hypothetical protein